MNKYTNVVLTVIAVALCFLSFEVYNYNKNLVTVGKLRAAVSTKKKQLRDNIPLVQVNGGDVEVTGHIYVDGGNVEVQEM